MTYEEAEAETGKWLTGNLTCDKCCLPRKTALASGVVCDTYGNYRPYRLCGTCVHREERRINTREMYGRGRRGY